MAETSQLELKAEKQSLGLLIQENLSSNPLIQSIMQVLCRVSDFKELVKAYYFEVILSLYRCPICDDRLQIKGPSQCSCSSGHTFDPTLEFQQSSCCGAKLVSKTFHYACSRCHQSVPSSFLFDERIFDRAYFREMMGEARTRERRKREELKLLMAGSRSDTLLLTEEPVLESIEGLTEALDGFIGTEMGGLKDFLSSPDFSMGDYRNHILSVIGTGSMLFSDIPPLIGESRRDKIWRFITLVFLQQDREVSLTQYGADILVGTVQVEAYG